MLRPLIEAAQREVILISPYFIPSDRGARILQSLAARGVRVRILTNSLVSTDAPVVHAAYARFRPRLVAAGVEIHEMRGDETRGPLRGTFFDEAVQPGRVFRVAPADGDATQIVWITEESEAEVRYASEPRAGWGRRVLMRVLDTFTPEHLR